MPPNRNSPKTKSDDVVMTSVTIPSIEESWKVPSFYANAIFFSWDIGGEFCFKFGRWGEAAPAIDNKVEVPFLHDLSLFMTQKTSLEMVRLMLEAFDPSKLDEDFISVLNDILKKRSTESSRSSRK